MKPISYDEICTASKEQIVEFINRRQRQILVHSYLYEDRNTNIIDDSTWDLWAKQLAGLMTRPEAKDSAYYKYFDGWTGDTASDLQEAYRLPEIMDKGNSLLVIERRNI
jgi:hypothetical protein